MLFALCLSTDPCGYASKHLSVEQYNMVQNLVNDRGNTGLLWSHFDPKARTPLLEPIPQLDYT